MWEKASCLELFIEILYFYNCCSEDFVNQENYQAQMKMEKSAVPV
jgi:hypothetical protein